MLNIVGWDNKQALKEAAASQKRITIRDVNTPSQKSSSDRARSKLGGLQAQQVNAYARYHADAQRSKAVQAYYKTPSNKRPTNVTDIIDANYMGMRT